MRSTTTNNPNNECANRRNVDEAIHGIPKESGINYARYLSFLSDRFSLPIDVFKPDKIFTQDFGIDSLALYSMVSDVEKEFNIKLDIDDLMEMSTVGASFEKIYKECHCRG